MTRRALRPKVSVGADVAPVISKAEGVPCGAFGSITVLIPRFAFPALVGGARRRKILSQKECGAKRAPSSLVSRVLRGWLEGEKFPICSRLSGVARRAS